jgi:hypothetical protein
LVRYWLLLIHSYFRYTNCLYCITRLSTGYLGNLYTGSALWFYNLLFVKLAWSKLTESQCQDTAIKLKLTIEEERKRIEHVTHRTVWKRFNHQQIYYCIANIPINVQYSMYATSVTDPGCFFPDQTFFHPGSASKNLIF